MWGQGGEKVVKIAPSVLSADFASLAEEIAKVETAADLLHVDVMDGHFVPNITVGPLVVEAMRKRTRLPLDVHLMIEAPERYIAAFARAGAASLTVHVETCPHLHRTLQQIREAGPKVGVSLNPATPLAALDYVLPDVDLVLVMSVNPGFGGQRFIPAALGKIAELAQRVRALPSPPELEVDGGIKLENCREVAAAGATILVAGSAIFGAADPRAAVEEMRRRVG
ncbi:MAG: ribulose-phosphate 3-epimerase [candidate division NC10 bacterium]|nr:ribulose-phosphate 3-epimerase [candidate division NC10 bacterium]